MNVCDCPNCKYSRGEISEDYYLGYLQGCITEKLHFIKNMKKAGYKPTTLTDKGIGGYLAVIRCSIDDDWNMFDELKELKTFGRKNK